MLYREGGKRGRWADLKSMSQRGFKISGWRQDQSKTGNEGMWGNNLHHAVSDNHLRGSTVLPRCESKRAGEESEECDERQESKCRHSCEIVEE